MNPDKLRSCVEKGLNAGDKFLSKKGRFMYDTNEIVREFIARGGRIMTAMRHKETNEIVCYEWFTIIGEECDS